MKIKIKNPNIIDFFIELYQVIDFDFLNLFIFIVFSKKFHELNLKNLTKFCWDSLVDSYFFKKN